MLSQEGWNSSWWLGFPIRRSAGSCRYTRHGQVLKIHYGHLFRVPQTSWELPSLSDSGTNRLHPHEKQTWVWGRGSIFSSSIEIYDFDTKEPLGSRQWKFTRKYSEFFIWGWELFSFGEGWHFLLLANSAALLAAHRKSTPSSHSDNQKNASTKF